VLGSPPLEIPQACREPGRGRWAARDRGGAAAAAARFSTAPALSGSCSPRALGVAVAGGAASGRGRRPCGRDAASWPWPSIPPTGAMPDSIGYDLQHGTKGAPVGQVDMANAPLSSAGLKVRQTIWEIARTVCT